MIVHTIYTASLLRPSLPYFRAKLLYRVILPPLHAPPPPRAGHSSRFVILYACCKCRRACIKRVENSLRTAWSWPFSMISDGLLGWCPEAVILPSRPVGGVWLRDYLLCFAKNGNMYVANNSSVLPQHVDRRSSRLLPHNRASLISVREFVGGGLNCEAKAQVLIVMPSPFFFPGSRSQKGGA